MAKTGDILLFKTRHILSDFQRFFTRDNYDHIAFIQSNYGGCISRIVCLGSVSCLLPSRMWYYLSCGKFSHPAKILLRGESPKTFMGEQIAFPSRGEKVERTRLPFQWHSPVEVRSICNRDLLIVITFVHIGL